MKKDNVENFFKNYYNVLDAINEKKKNASNEEIEELIIYEKSIKALISQLVNYVKNVFDSISYGSNDDYKSVEEYLDVVSNINQKRISSHNILISYIKVADLICQKLDVPPLFGKLGEFETDVDPLMQTDPNDRHNMSKKVLEKRQEIFEWACNIILPSLARNQANKYSDYLVNPESFKIVADYYKYLSNEEIIEYVNSYNGKKKV